MYKQLNVGHSRAGSGLRRCTDLAVAITILNSKTDLKNKEADAVNTGSCEDPSEKYGEKGSFLVQPFMSAEPFSKVYGLHSV